MKIYFVRHGETPWNKEKRVQGQQDIPLNEKGRELARMTRDGMADISFDRIYSSPLSRAYETAEIISGVDNPVIYADDRLKEISFGTAEGVSILEASKEKDSFISCFFHCPEEYEPAEGGETLSHVRERGLQFIQSELVPLEKECENILLVAHACIIRSMMSALLDIPISELWSGPAYKNCCVSIVECKEGKLTVLEEAKLYYKEEQKEK
ncbi:MAG: histidine phosphatase family protein [Lachnospiraceae bacterium]|nr:histidine phosphatase family protein [Lachnospiraceae bacterium]